MGCETRKVLAPDYLREFHCLGNACEDNCCVGYWKIFVDKGTWLKYRKLPPSPLKKLMEKRIVRNRKQSNDENYSKINFQGEYQCPFLNQERLCRIQLEHGEQYLCNVCRTYPRYANRVGGKLEITMTLSCPEAARIALLKKDGMRFAEMEIDADTPLLINSRLSNEVLKNTGGKYFYGLRNFTVDCLQAREYELWQRLMILGLFYQTIQGYCDNKTIDEIPEAIEKYRKMVAAGMFRDMFDAIPTATVVQRKILKLLVDERLTTLVFDKQYMDCLIKVFLGLNYFNDSTEEQLEAAYRIAYEEDYKSFEEQYGYILENHLVNYVFEYLFPLGGEIRIFDNYVKMILNYSLLKIHLLGTVRYYGSALDVSHIIGVIQRFVKVTEHDLKYIQRIFQLIKDSQMDTMPYLAILIKN